MSNAQKRKTELAKKWGIKNWEGMTSTEFFAEVTKRSTADAAKPAEKVVEKPVEKKDEPKKEVAVVKTEEAASTTSSTTTNSKHEVSVQAPVFNMHVPSPTIHIEAGKFPGLWAVLAKAHTAVLHMVLGAAMYAVLGRKLLLVAGL